MNPLSYYDPDDPYPESDGQPMAENAEQYDWIVKIKENLEILFADREDVFIAGDLLWYPVPDRRVSGPLAPDVMVAFGRPKGRRGTYRQWEEGGVAPQVVFEVLSPGNTIAEMTRKFRFYERFGVEEYYVYDPDRGELSGWLRRGDLLEEIDEMQGWVSPRLGVRFSLDGMDLVLQRPNGSKFETFVELQQRADAEHQRADAEQQRADVERQRADRLAARLRELGVEPDAPAP